MKKIIEGIATRWDHEKLRLIVEIDKNEVGFVPADELTAYSDFKVKDSYCRAAAYCIGIKLPYIVTTTTIDGALLSRRLLAEDTIATLKSEKFHDYVMGTITGVEEKSIFVDVNGVYGKCPVDELSYTYLSHCGLAFERGEKFQFAISSITEENKLCLSRIATLPLKETLLKEYKPNDIIRGNIIARADPRRDSEETTSWYFITDHTIAGIVEVPLKKFVKPGMEVSIVVSRIVEKGLRGTLAC